MKHGLGVPWPGLLPAKDSLLWSFASFPPRWPERLALRLPPSFHALQTSASAAAASLFLGVKAISATGVRRQKRFFSLNHFIDIRILVQESHATNPKEKKMLKTTLFVLSASLAVISGASAQTLWANPGTAGNWNVDANWSTPATVPGAGTTVDLTATANNTTEITVSDAQEVLAFANGARGSLIIANGGTLTGYGTGSSDFRGNMTLTVENGGTFVGGAAGAQTLRFGNSTIDAGGELDGFTSLLFAPLEVNGLWKPKATSNGQVTLNGSASLNGTGTIRLDMVGSNNSSNEYFYFVTAPGLSDFSNFTLELVPSYTVQVDDVFTLWNVRDEFTNLDNVTFGDGSNIVLTGAPGLGLDVSNWATTGVVTVVPEPSTFVLMALAGGMVCLIRRQRRG